MTGKKAQAKRIAKLVSRTKPNRATAVTDLMLQEISESYEYRTAEIKVMHREASTAKPYEMFDRMSALAHRLQLTVDRVRSLMHSYVENELREEE